MREIKTRLAVIGGGPAGVCAALTAARHGVSTVLVGDRPVLGGNSSSEIRVWTRGATGAGNLFAEEMGVWGRLKLKNLYRNPDGNPVFWDEVLLDEVLQQENLTLYLNTEIFEVEMEGNVVRSVAGVQQSSEMLLHIEADIFLDCTGDSTIGAKAGAPYVVGDDAGGLLGSSILYYTRKEDHPVRFVAPDYAYDIETIHKMVGQGGRVLNEKMSGSDCWWFEYGGLRDTIADAQDIGLELRRLVMGVWNYIKNSGLYDADCYTLEWIGSLPGKRESRRMLTEYLLTQEDVLQERKFPDGAFYGGWYIDIHPAGGMHDADEENCIQIPVMVYQLPLRALYHRDYPNLLFAGRNIGVTRDVFFSSRIMNTCALSGQAAGVLAAACLRNDCAPAALTAETVDQIRQTLLRDDMFIPGVRADDPADLAQKAAVTASSSHDGRPAEQTGLYNLEQGGFVTFPAVEGEIRLELRCTEPGILRAKRYLADLPGRLQPGQEEGTLQWLLQPGKTYISCEIDPAEAGRFCTWVFEPTAGVSVVLCRKGRTGFVCGRAKEPEYYEPAMAYISAAQLYEPEQVVNGYARPWSGVNQWRAAPSDQTPWLQLTWQQPVEASVIEVYLDPELSMELPSSFAKHWEASHYFSPRTEMPAQLVKSLRLCAADGGGGWHTLCALEDNCLRHVTLRLPETVSTTALRLYADETWGDQSPAVYELRVYGPQA